MNTGAVSPDDPYFRRGWSAEEAAALRYAENISALDDSQLYQYLEHREKVFYVEDPDNLPSHFLGRLRERTSRPTYADLTHPLDVNRVNARLENRSLILSKVMRYASSPETSRRVSPEPFIPGPTDIESARYEELILEGGRPSHPLEVVQGIVELPAEFTDIVDFWQAEFHGLKYRPLITLQLDRWLEFRGLQRFARGESTYEVYDGRWEFIRDHERLQPDRPWSYQWKSSDREWFTSGDHRGQLIELRGEWCSWVELLPRNAQTTNCRGFAQYLEALEQRLQNHGFCKRVCFKNPLEDQDLVTTWMEYLGYELWWLEKFAATCEDLKSQYDKAWPKLVAANILEAHETRQTITDVESTFRREREECFAQKAIKSAKLALFAAANDSRRSSPSTASPEAARERLRSARRIMRTTTKKMDAIKYREKCFADYLAHTCEYESNWKQLTRQKVLVQWIEQQIESMQPEQQETQSVEADKIGSSMEIASNQGTKLSVNDRKLTTLRETDTAPVENASCASIKETKRSRAVEDDTWGRPQSKKAKLAPRTMAEFATISSATRTRKIAGTASRARFSGRQLPQNAPVVTVRRSARIAGRREN